MRTIASILLLVVVVGWLAREIPSSATVEPRPETCWRRTADGWERGEWLGRPSFAVEALHPAVLAYVEVLLSVLAFVWFPPPGENRLPLD